MVPVAEIIFWASLLIVFYTYAGYPLLLGILVKITKSVCKSNSYASTSDACPTVTLIIAAYNEEEILEKKLLNSLDIDYPQEKFNIILITDGSDDGSNQIA